MKNQSLGAELPGLRVKAKSLQRLTKSFFCSLKYLYFYCVSEAYDMIEVSNYGNRSDLFTTEKV